MASLFPGYTLRRPGSHHARSATRRHLPPSVDLRAFLPPVTESGGSGVASAVSAAGAYLLRRKNRRARPVSADDGAAIGDALAGLPAAGIGDAVAVVPLALDAWRSSLADGYPIVFGLSLYASFGQQRRGLVPLPTRGELSGDGRVGHALLCVGYADRDQVFIVRGAWGAGWGEEGCCYIPYRYVLDAQHGSEDAWVVRWREPLPARSTWGSGESVLAHLTAVLARMSNHDYDAMLAAMADVPVEDRVALLMLTAADADDELSDEELVSIRDYLAHFLEILGIQRVAEDILGRAARLRGDAELLDETIALLGAHLPQAALASLVGDLTELSAQDALSEDEDAFLRNLVRAWQVAP